MAPSFRSPKAQARYAIQQALAIGDSKPSTGSAQVHSLGTARTYCTALGIFARWRHERGYGFDLRTVTKEEAVEWLEERSECVAQKALDIDRLALVKAMGFEIPRLPSNFASRRQLFLESRAYSVEQIDEIARHQSERNGFSTQLASEAGLRAHELLTLSLACERPATDLRPWDEDRFLGMSGARYTVAGKGGLVREVLIPSATASELELTRRAKPTSVQDRGINYLTIYDIAGGNAWSTSFSAASLRAVGYSHGAHGLRHGYVQRRLDDLQRLGFSYEDALAVISQEVGHFRPDVTEIYLR